MLLKDAEGWELTVKNNDDPYGKAGVDFARRWAEMMEDYIAGGCALEDIAQQTKCEADTDGITGFMYGCAVSVLSQVWVYGEELRRWSNLKLQIGNEGEQANEEGGVLNPALLRIGKKPRNAENGEKP